MTDSQWWGLLDRHYSWLVIWVHKWGTEDALTRFCHGAKLRSELGREMVVAALVNAYWRNPYRDPQEVAEHDRQAFAALMRLYGYGVHGS